MLQGFSVLTSLSDFKSTEYPYKHMKFSAAKEVGVKLKEPSLTHFPVPQQIQYHNTCNASNASRTTNDKQSAADEHRRTFEKAFKKHDQPTAVSEHFFYPWTHSDHSCRTRQFEQRQNPQDKREIFYFKSKYT